MKDYYATLGLQSTASDEEIKSSYRKLAKQFHPDLNKESDSEQRFKEVTEAYETLKDPAKRSQYDNAKRFGGNFGGFDSDMSSSRWREFTSRHFSGHGFGFDPFEDIMDTMMNGGFQQRPQRNKDIHIKYGINLEEVFTGKQTEIKYRTHVNNVPETLVLQIPPGIMNGARLHFPGKGEKTVNNLPPGDLYVTITYNRHHLFSVDQVNLIYNSDIDYIDATLGCTILVPLLEGGQAKVNIPAGIRTGQLIRIVGKGMRKFKSTDRGDMLIHVNAVPPQLTPEQLERLSKVK